MSGAIEELKKFECLIGDLLLLANTRADDTITGNELISCLLKNGIEIEQKEGFIWKKKKLQGLKK